MKKLIKLSLIFGVLALATFTSCKKDEPEEEDIKTAADMLSGEGTRTWKVSVVKQNGQTIGIDPCDADDRLTFNSEGSTMKVDFGTNHCNSGEVNINGTWSLANNDKSLITKFTYMGFPIVDTIQLVSVTDEKFITTETQDSTVTLTTYVKL